MDRIAGDERFPKEEHLRKRREFLKVYETGEKVQGRYFFLFFLPNNLPYSRLGLTVSKKIGKTATRNFIKRRLREVFRRDKQVLSLPADVVVNVKQSAARASYEGLREDFLGAVRRWLRE